MSSSLDDLYREIILDHYRSPRGKKPLANPTVSSDGQNPSCGDEIAVSLELEADILKDVNVKCKGCAISVASGSMLAETVKGKPFTEVQRIAETVKKILKGEQTELPDDIGDLSALQGVRQFPVRIKCALLAWITLIESLKRYEEGRPNDTAIVSTEDDE